MPVAIFVDHQCHGIFESGFDHNEPVRSAYFTEVTSDGIHHPKTLSVLGEVLSSISQQVSAPYTVAALGTGDLCQVGCVKYGHGMRRKVAFKHAVCCQLGYWTT